MRETKQGEAKAMLARPVKALKVLTCHQFLLLSALVWHHGSLLTNQDLPVSCYTSIVWVISGAASILCCCI